MGKPILFNAENIRAILAGKTQTRRIMKPQPFQGGPRWEGNRFERIDQIGQAIFSDGTVVRCPYGVPGDTLWVREGYQVTDSSMLDESVRGHYLADSAPFQAQLTEAEFAKWYARRYPWRATPGRFMYKSLARIRTSVVGIRVERVQAIGTEDVYAEGAISNEWLDWQEDVQSIGLPSGSYIERERDVFAALWDSINAKRGYGWEVNPWVWVVTFERLVTNG